MTTNKRLLKWNILFFFVAIPLIFVQHFLYEFSGNAKIAAIIGAANESVWEHMKIIFLPFLLVSIVIFIIVKPSFVRYFIATTAGLITIIVSMLTLYYTYVGIIGQDVLIVDILLSIFVLFLGFLVSYKLYTKWENANKYFGLFFIAFILLIVIYIVFTLYPPELPLFLDTVTKTYGIPAPINNKITILLDK